MEQDDIQFIVENPFNFGILEYQGENHDPFILFKNIIETQANQSIDCVARGTKISVWQVVFNFSVN